MLVLTLLACMPTLPIEAPCPEAFLDRDGDGWGSEPTIQCDAPRSVNGGDCDDTDAAVHPDAEETCDARDRNCDGDPVAGSVDQSTWYVDDDGDGWGGDAVTGCEVPADALLDGGDCDDTDETVFPGADEYCDAVDSDCDDDLDDPDSVDAQTWYADTDEDFYGDPGAPVSGCTQPEGTVSDASDCDDTDWFTNPDGVEICGDGRDNDCDGTPNGCFPYGERDLYEDSSVLIGVGDNDGDPVLFAAHTGAGDLNGDGSPDLVLAARATDPDGRPDNGSVYVLFGPITSPDTPLSIETNVTLMNGGTSGGRFGTRMVVAPDLDGDGRDDVVVQAQSVSGFSEGQVFVFTDVTPGSITTADAIWSANGGPSDAFGLGLDAPGDLDGDGVGDLLIGAPGNDATATNGGRVFAFYGPFDGSTPSSWDIAGTTDGGVLGSTLGHGDTDGDGVIDVVIGAPENDQVTVITNGFHGASLSDGFTWTGQGYAGGAVHLMDVSGDGHDDLVVGAPDWGDGRVVVIEGPVNSGGSLVTDADAVLLGYDGGAAGATIAPRCDQNADGVHDLLIGSPDNDLAHLVLGPIAGTVDLASDADGTYSGGWGTGYGLTCVPDSDGDGNGELLFGMPLVDTASLILGSPGI